MAGKKIKSKKKSKKSKPKAKKNIFVDPVTGMKEKSSSESFFRSSHF